jgi:hypothetical protein
MDSVGTIFHLVVSIGTAQAMFIVRLLCLELDRRANDAAHGIV